MRNRVKIITGLLIGLSIASTSYATLELELTKGVDSAVPIAIMPLQITGSQPSTNVAQVIANDLKNSGEFKIVDTSNVNPPPASVNDIHVADWQQSKTDYVTAGTLNHSGSANQVNLSLLDIYKAAQAGNANDAVLLNENFSARDEGLRALGHQIADLIYEKITGVKGTFSTKIAYVLVQPVNGSFMQYSLMVADADGQNARALLTTNQPILSPAWSFDGKKIAYVSLENRQAAIYISDVDSGHRSLLTEYAGINGAPAWSPDGSQLAIVLTRGAGTNIFTIGTGGFGSPHQLTQGFSIDTEPSFSPDGKSVLFTSDRGGSPQIYQLNLSSGSVKRLTFAGDYNTTASFASDGQNIVFLHRQNGQYNVAMQDLSNGAVTILTHASSDQAPSLSPNGKMVIYATQSGRRTRLNFVSTDGRIRLTFPESNGDAREPAWGPFAS
ncbi:MAG: Tol-Pal system beta propeller repeat protein TolB [Gammaproteobacteria bacterium GWE2_42_36]|nr:MAG: Tol-Pal system beta propeller repeat protein TolB [Gammaproteobacteria bacterium GWE2_42_36]HCU05270.1 Tol-Pal system beta propeller repeat protein TolB [Coxiellaceae bacterium]